MPNASREQLDADAELDLIRIELKETEDAATFETQVRVLRNRLSHGTHNYEDDALQPWVRALETICRAHLLRLLEFPEPAVEAALQGDAAPKSRCREESAYARLFKAAEVSRRSQSSGEHTPPPRMNKLRFPASSSTTCELSLRNAPGVGSNSPGFREMVRRVD
jgi:hypothetical protein